MVKAVFFGRFLAITSIVLASSLMPLGQKTTAKATDYIESFKPQPCTENHPKKIARIGRWQLYIRDLIYIMTILFTSITFILTTVYYAKKAK